MAYITGTATDYQDALTKLINAATGNGATAAAIAGGGTGYAVDDILTVSGGTANNVATLRVTSVSSGVIDGIAVEQGGSYTVNPTNAVSVTGGGGSGATFNLTMASNGWTVSRNNPRMSNMTLSATGTGYAVDDELTVSGGTFTEAMMIRVLTLSGSAIATFEVITEGVYTVLPSSAVSTTTTGGGSGATFTYIAESEVILEGSGDGSDEIYIGFRSEDHLSSNGQNLELSGFTGYTPTVTFENQPGKTPGGLYGDENGQGCYVLLDDVSSFTYWFSINSYRITGAFYVGGSTYESFYMGYLAAMATATQAPYPMYIAGSSAIQSRYTTDRISHSSIADPRTKEHAVAVGTRAGPAYMNIPGIGWKITFNAAEDYSNQNTIEEVDQPDVVCWPCGNFKLGDAEYGDNASNAPAFGAAYVDFHRTSSYKNPISDVPSFRIHPTPDTPNDIIPLFNCMIYNRDGFYGELQGIFWFSAYGSTINAQDEIVLGSERYICFLAGNRTSESAFWCMKKE